MKERPDETVSERTNRLHLKGIIKGLAETSISLRKIERTLIGSKRRAIHEGRVVGVRQHARAAQLAYGFLRGRPYDVVEGKCHDAPDWDRVLEFISVHTDEPSNVWLQRYAEWLDNAELLPEHCRPRLDRTGLATMATS